MGHCTRLLMVAFLCCGSAFPPTVNAAAPPFASFPSPLGGGGGGQYAPADPILPLPGDFRRRFTSSIHLALANIASGRDAHKTVEVAAICHDDENPLRLLRITVKRDGLSVHYKDGSGLPATKTLAVNECYKYLSIAHDLPSRLVITYDKGPLVRERLWAVDPRGPGKRIRYSLTLIDGKPVITEVQ
jgi:hypothetical protein